VDRQQHRADAIRLLMGGAGTVAATVTITVVGVGAICAGSR
jgi:hypothetical protein